MRYVPYIRPKRLKTHLAPHKTIYIITKSMHAHWLVNQLWVIVPVNPWKNCASSELLYNSNRPQISMGYINNSRHLARKYARIFVRGHYLFREANSFPRAKLEENCELQGTDNVQGQISEHIFAPNGDYCLYYPSNLFRNARSFESWGIFNN